MKVIVPLGLLLLVLVFVPGHCSTIHENGREMAMIARLMQLHRAESAYYAEHGVYMASLAELHIPLDRRWWIDLRLSPTGYSVTAIPKEFGEDGRRTFYMDETQVIRNEWSGETVASAASGLVR